MFDYTCVSKQQNTEIMLHDCAYLASIVNCLLITELPFMFYSLDTVI